MGAYILEAIFSETKGPIFDLESELLLDGLILPCHPNAQPILPKAVD